MWFYDGNVSALYTVAEMLTLILYKIMLHVTVLCKKLLQGRLLSFIF